MEVYQIVTDKIVAMLEARVVPWRRPWTSAGLPRNLVTKKPYRGINHFLLSASNSVSPFWLTLKQANELGGSVLKGEQSTIIVFWKVDRKEGDKDDTGDEETQRRFLLGYYRVLKVEQCDLPQARLDRLPKIETHDHNSTHAAELIVANMPNARNRAFRLKGLLQSAPRPPVCGELLILAETTSETQSCESLTYR